MKRHQSIIPDFKKLLDAEDSTEQSFQDYLEQHTKLFFPPFEQNHSVHLSLLLSKLKIDTSLTTDFAYLTKSSASWWLVLVEIEHPSKRLFGKRAIPSAELTAAISQVNDWRTFIERNPSIIEQKISPLKKPLAGNKMKVRYALVIGRTKEFEKNQEKMDAFEGLQREDFKVLTYDSLVSAYQVRQNQLLDVMSQKGQKFSFKYRHRSDTLVFSWLSPNEIHIEPNDIEYYKGLGYDIDRWLKGDLLVVNGKKTDDEKFTAFKERMKTLHGARPKKS